MDKFSWQELGTANSSTSVEEQAYAKTTPDYPSKGVRNWNRSQSCTFGLETPIAVTNTNREVRKHQLSASIVEGAEGSLLPGLLGLQTLEKYKAIFDCGKQQMHFVGDGEVELKLPSGSFSIPLYKAPSGHLTMITDDFEALSA